MDWTEQARKWAEGGLNPSEMYEMPFSRLYAIYYMPKPESNVVSFDNPEDLRAFRNERRKRMGLTPLPEPKPKE